MKVDAIYIGTQSSDSAELVLEQLMQVGVKAFIYGNEQVGHIPTSVTAPEITFAEPAFEISAPRTAAFIEAWTKKTGSAELPLGIWTAEAYDAVKLLASVMTRCGETVQAVRDCLLNTKDYPGASGFVTINSQGDGVRKYSIKRRLPSGSVNVIEPTR